jgi:hypothetical protein
MTELSDFLTYCCATHGRGVDPRKLTDPFFATAHIVRCVDMARLSGRLNASAYRLAEAYLRHVQVRMPARAC